MSGMMALFLKELRSYFYSMLGYVVLVVSLLFNAYSFSILLIVLNDPRITVEGSAMQFFFGRTFFFYIVLSIIAAVVTMRLIAEERKTGTIEVLMTAPVTDWQIVLSKFFGALAFYVFLWIPTLFYIVLLKWHAQIDLGPVWAGYLGTFLLGAMFMAIGLLCSSMTKNQIVASVTSFVIITVVWTIGLFEMFVSGSLAQGIIGHVNIFEHFEGFSRGIVDTRPLIYYLSATALCLFLTVKVVEARKWR